MSILRHIQMLNKEIHSVTINEREEMTTENAVSLGLTAELYPVEKGYDNVWYLEGYAPKKPLDFAKNEKIAELKRKRDENEQDYFVYDGHRYNSDSTSCQRITNTVMVASAMGEAFKMDWTDYENNEVPMNAQGMFGLQQALMQHSLACHTQYRELKESVTKAKSVKKVESIEWTYITDGWVEDEVPVDNESSESAGTSTITN